jgi:hypothetical protein
MYTCPLAGMHIQWGTNKQEVNIGARQRVDPSLLSDEELQQKLSQVLSQASSTLFVQITLCWIHALYMFDCMKCLSSHASQVSLVHTVCSIRIHLYTWRVPCNCGISLPTDTMLTHCLNVCILHVDILYTQKQMLSGTAAIPADRPLHELGLDSLSIGQFSGLLEQVQTTATNCTFKTFAQMTLACIV